MAVAATALGPVVLNVDLSTDIAPLTDGGITYSDYPNNHGILIRNGPIGDTDNTINIGYAFADDAEVFLWLKPGEAVSLQPADAGNTNAIWLIAASGTPTIAVSVSG